MANMFNEDGTYNKTEWKAGDKITAVKLNKIELSLEAINNNDIDRHVEADSRLDILEERITNTPDNEQMNALMDMVKDNKDAVDLAVYDINSSINSLDVRINNTINTTKLNIENRVDDINQRISNVKNYVTYEEFGVVCDGTHDDGVEIKAAHEYANNNNLKVIATGKTYYIKETVDIPVMTDTDFNGATFIIDDRLDTDKQKGVFVVKSKYNSVTRTVDFKLDKLTKRIPELSGNGLCLVEVFDENVKHFIRFGANANTGKSKRDYFVIDNNGNILNDIMWDFENITSTVMYPMDKNLLTISNGHFVTIPNNDALVSKYYKRGIHVKRSNVVLQGISHELREEAPGSPYDGFMYFEKSANIHVRDCILQSRMMYNRESDGVNMGSYDIQFNGCVNVNLYNVIDRSFNDDRWGIHKFAYSKDAIIEKCKLTRVDAHEGVYNLKIRDCLLGHHGVRIVGGGLCEIDNVDVVGSSTLVALRSDYGSFWDGDMYIRNVKFTPGPITFTPKLLDIENIGTHDFGYECRAPRRLVMENITINDTIVKETEGTQYKFMFIFYNSAEKVGTIGNIKHNYKFIEHAEFRNIKTTSGSGFKIFYTNPSNLYLDKEHTYITTSKIDDANKQLIVEPNMNIIIDNVELVDFPEGTTNGTNNIFSYTGEIDTDLVVNNKHTAIPNLTLINCDNVCACLNDVPMVFNVKDSTVKVLTAVKNDKTMMTGVADNCIFNPVLSSLSRVINPNWYGFTFINCRFNSPRIIGQQTMDAASVARAVGFLEKFKLTSDTYFRASVKMINCTMFNFDFTTLNSVIDCMDFKFGNHNFEFHFRHTGWDSTKPTNSGHPVPAGFVYYLLSGDKFIIWTGEKWIDS